MEVRRHAQHTRHLTRSIERSDFPRPNCIHPDGALLQSTQISSTSPPAQCASNPSIGRLNLQPNSSSRDSRGSELEASARSNESLRMSSRMSLSSRTLAGDSRRHDTTRHDTCSAQPHLMQLRQPLFGSVRARFRLLSCRTGSCGQPSHKRPASCCGCSTPTVECSWLLVSICWPQSQLRVQCARFDGSQAAAAACCFAA